MVLYVDRASKRPLTQRQNHVLSEWHGGIANATRFIPPARKVKEAGAL
jgi:hypothetical protein